MPLGSEIVEFDDSSPGKRTTSNGIEPSVTPVQKEKQDQGSVIPTAPIDIAEIEGGGAPCTASS